LDDEVAEGGTEVKCLEHRVGVTVTGACMCRWKRWEEIYKERAEMTHQVFPNCTGGVGRQGRARAGGFERSQTSTEGGEWDTQGGGANHTHVFETKLLLICDVDGRLGGIGGDGRGRGRLLRGCKWHPFRGLSYRHCLRGGEKEGKECERKKERKGGIRDT
jgi:hypothetical protein